MRFSFWEGEIFWGTLPLPGLMEVTGKILFYKGLTRREVR